MTFNTTVHQECHFGVHMVIFVILNSRVPRTIHTRTRTLKDQDMEGSQTFFWNKKTSAPTIRCTVRRRQTWRNSCRAHDKWHSIPHTIAKQKTKAGQTFVSETPSSIGSSACCLQTSLYYGRHEWCVATARVLETAVWKMRTIVKHDHTISLIVALKDPYSWTRRRLHNRFFRHSTKLNGVYVEFSTATVLK